MNTKPSFPKDHSPFRDNLVVAALVCALSALFPTLADAALARVRWLPRGDAPPTQYAIYVRDAGATHAGVPQWTGSPVPDVDGTLSALVSFTPSASGANYFAVVAMDSGLESALSRELPTGTPIPCRNDKCMTKTTCDFRALADGATCDDGSFCNGAETCVAGACADRTPRDCADQYACTMDACDDAANACTHTASPGCCPACDSGDPCLENACVSGYCPASPGTEIALERMRFTSRRSGVELAIRGRFPAETVLDPSTTGATVELRTPDGVVLHSATVPAEAFEADAAGEQHRYAVSRTEAEELGFGIHRLDFRLIDATWVVSASMRTPDLMDAFLEPTLSVVLRVGDSCVRRMNATCDQRDGVSVCG